MELSCDARISGRRSMHRKHLDYCGALAVILMGLFSVAGAACAGGEDMYFDVVPPGRWCVRQVTDTDNPVQVPVGNQIAVRVAGGRVCCPLWLGSFFEDDWSYVMNAANCSMDPDAFTEGDWKFVPPLAPMNAPPPGMNFVWARCQGDPLQDREDPRITFGPPGGWEGTVAGDRQDYCQHGLQDDYPGSGYTLNQDYQLGIGCVEPNCIDEVGFYVEFIVVPGVLDIVIYDETIEVSRTSVSPVQGINNFSLDGGPVNISGNACIMLCPVGSYWSVLGEDATNKPFCYSYQSTDCACDEDAELNVNLTMWARTSDCHPTPTREVTWGRIKSAFR